jgi:hypothetical protein
MSDSQSYVGRTIDLAVFQGTAARGDIRLVQALALEGGSGAVTTGVVKLGQRFLMELFTELGSMKHRPERGSTFLLELRSGLIRTTTDLFAAFSRALLDVRRNLLSDEIADGPADEKLLSSEIINVELNGDHAVVSVRVTSQDPAAQLILPVSMAL